jgi:hypothetical protein
MRAVKPVGREQRVSEGQSNQYACKAWSRNRYAEDDHCQDSNGDQGCRYDYEPASVPTTVNAIDWGRLPKVLCHDIAKLT